jgi:glycosyltransferase involved in cell wall biosynthesis
MGVRLFVALPGTARGGAEDYALTISRAAAARGWEVTAALPFGPGTATLVQDFRAAVGEVVPIPAMDDDAEATRFTKVRAAARLARVLRRPRPDVVHVTLPWPTQGLALLAAAALLGLPTMVAFQLVPDGLVVSNRWRLVYRLIRRRRQRWIAVSDHGRRLIGTLYGVDRNSIGLIHNGARASPARDMGSPEEARRSVRAELGLSTRALVLLSVGRLDSQKGHADLVHAFAALRAQRGDVRLLIAGEGAERERLDQLVVRLRLGQDVRLLGYRFDAARLMNAADIFVFPSHFEGTPFALLEAMTHGLPVVAAQFGGADEIVEDGGSGVLVPIGNVQALAVAILGLLGDPERLARLGAAGQQRARAFTEATMIDETLAELERLGAS